MYNGDNMNIKIPLLSVVSTVLLLSLFIAGNDVSLDALCIDFAMSNSTTTVSIHPTWEVSAPEEYLMSIGGLAYAYGNVMVIGDNLNGDPKAYVRAHERVHLMQYRALGCLMSLARYVLPIEPPARAQTGWTDLTEQARTMWQPPNWWPYKWSFVTITIPRS